VISTPNSGRTAHRSLLSALATAVALMVTWLAPGPAFAEARLLDVVAGEDPGTLRVWVRDAGDAVPVVDIDEDTVPLVATESSNSTRFKPLLMVVDSSHITPDLLQRIRKHVKELAEREMNNGSRLVMVADQRGRLQMLEDVSHIGENAEAWKKFLAGLTLEENPNPGKPFYSSVGAVIPSVLRREQGSTTKKVWAIVFSSLCVEPGEQPLALDSFKGPVRLITWDTGLDKNCLKSKKQWLAASTNEKLELLTLGEDNEAIKTALAGVPFNDLEIVLGPAKDSKGMDYRGGAFVIDVHLPGAGDKGAWKATFKEDTLPSEWSRSAKIKAAEGRKMQVATGFTVLFLLVVTGVVIKGRSSAVDFAKWEAVGEAEDLAAPPVDPDAWNATIFQLTGAMPIITEAHVKTAQLGPGAAFEDDDATKIQKSPAKAPEAPPAAPQAPDATPQAPTQVGPDAAAVAGSQPEDAAATGAQASAVGTPTGSTGMTVSIPVVDDGSAYDAKTPFEIGVLQAGKPVARKTKMFRKSFSIGRATDNRVVIQKDDTVHRYHIVVRPAVEGKEWWLEVSPTATNRTRLNGKDLRPGGRYRVPGRFRLQLGEATEVRGRLSKKAS